ncbi:hypothetical protein SAMN05660330_02191 [Desulforhopalus singaporensis]|uniref:Uncharacterized protein n=1 Tax=Desulforhopalus singaporensis TaxID=91360 RepID=A0A1H0R6K7_9BACT|nr:hypothetical protein SAMN05660330_02191 [Desulforhopalus singaporensis]
MSISVNDSCTNISDANVQEYTTSKFHQRSLKASLALLNGLMRYCRTVFDPV